jgi:hypothetical protein
MMVMPITTSECNYYGYDGCFLFFCSFECSHETYIATKNAIYLICCQPCKQTSCRLFNEYIGYNKIFKANYDTLPLQTLLLFPKVTTSFYAYVLILYYPLLCCQIKIYVKLTDNYLQVSNRLQSGCD